MLLGILGRKTTALLPGVGSGGYRSQGSSRFLSGTGSSARQQLTGPTAQGTHCQGVAAWSHQGGSSSGWLVRYGPATRSHLKMGAFKAAETSWPTYYDQITPNRLKSNRVGQPVSCVHHWDRTKTGGMGQRRPGNVRVTNAQRKDPELTEAATGQCAGPHLHWALSPETAPRRCLEAYDCQKANTQH